MKRLAGAGVALLVICSVALSACSTSSSEEPTAEPTATPIVAAPTDPQPQTLMVLLGSVIFVSPDFAIALDKGVRSYQEWELLDADGNEIGDYKFDGVSTEPMGTTGWYGQESFNIFGEGVIEGVSQGLPGKGSIIGGRGKFAGVSGEYTVVGIEGGVRYTFTFDTPPR